jgi:hypothetical protein
VKKGLYEINDWDKVTVQVRLLQGYKFAIVTENTNAFDYVTEKLFQALLAGTVPVYMGMSVHMVIQGSSMFVL